MQRTRHLSVRTSEAERLTMEAAAALRRQTVSDLVRDAALRAAHAELRSARRSGRGRNR